MGFVVQESFAKEGTGESDPTLELETTTQLKINDFTFKHAGTDYALGDDVLWDLPPSVPHVTRVHGYLVLNRTTGDPEVFVDEHIEDGIDEYFLFEGSNWKLLTDLFCIMLPASSTTLTGIDIKVFKVTPVAPPPRDDEE